MCVAFVADAQVSRDKKVRGSNRSCAVLSRHAGRNLNGVLSSESRGWLSPEKGGPGNWSSITVESKSKPIVGESPRRAP